MTTTPEYEIISPVQNILGEGPIWDTRDDRFYWVDAYQKRFYSASVPAAPASVRRVPTAHHTGFFTIGITPWGDTAGQFLLAADNALYRWSADTITPVVSDPFAELASAPPIAGASPITDPITAETHRFNDVIAGPAGEYYAGIMEWRPGRHGNRGTGALICFTDRHTPHVVMCGCRTAWDSAPTRAGSTSPTASQRRSTASPMTPTTRPAWDHRNRLSSPTTGREYPMDSPSPLMVPYSARAGAAPVLITTLPTAPSSISTASQCASQAASPWGTTRRHPACYLCNGRNRHPRPRC